MPPALSDYESSSESDIHEASVPTNKAFLPQAPSVEHAATYSSSPTPERFRQRSLAVLSKKRKRVGLLSGLDVSNIITVPSDEIIISTAEDSVLASSVPTSSYATRASSKGTRSKDLAYDQRYHPMDEYLRPSQAARHRAEHGIDNDEDSDSPAFEDQGDGDSGSDVEDQPQTKKRKKLDQHVIRQGIRRSSRRVNRDVLYDITVHPQDSQLAQMSTDSTTRDDCDAEDEVLSVGSSAAAKEVDDRAIYDTDEDASDPTASSPPPSTLFSMTSVNNSGHGTALLRHSHISHHNDRPLVNPCLERTRFDIHEESLQLQLAKEAAVTVPLEYEHDDKENTTEACDPDFDQFLHPSSMFDGANDQPGASSQLDSRSRMPVPIHGSDQDSGLDSDVNSIPGK